MADNLDVISMMIAPSLIALKQAGVDSLRHDAKLSDEYVEGAYKRVKEHDQWLIRKITFERDPQNAGKTFKEIEPVLLETDMETIRQANANATMLKAAAGMSTLRYG